MVDSNLKQLWEAIGTTIAGHVVMLGEVGLIEEEPAATLIAAIDAVRRADSPPLQVFRLVEAFDDRIDGQIPPGTIGVARVGRGVADVAAAASRIVIRQKLVALSKTLTALRSLLIDLAGKHLTTMMPTYAEGFVGQPTMLGHYLGGVIAPLGRAALQLQRVYFSVNKSPVGAGSLASTGLPIDRDHLAEILAFERPIAHSFDAVSAVDHFLEIGALIGSVEVTISRFIQDQLRWLSREPESFLARNGMRGTVDDLPQLRLPDELQRLAVQGRNVRRVAESIRDEASSQPYGALLTGGDELVRLTFAGFDTLGEFLTGATAFLTEQFDPNRAFLANRAGKGLGTSSDIAELLMIEEQIDPGAARAISALVTSRLIDEGLEISAITTDMIDGAALLTIGREIKIEFESISRYLAPRRFIERRTTLGGPAPVAVREYLDREEQQVAADRQWFEETNFRLARAERDFRRAVDDAAQRLDRG